MNQPATTSDDFIQAIFSNNAGRDPERLAMKYKKMMQSPFIFLRGACHLFYAALPDKPLFTAAPLAWCCGDLHFENYGSYKGDNRLVYFDINDYDEAALAPVTWDMVRLLTSLQCGAADLHATEAEALAVSRSCLDAYCGSLLHGKALWVERETAVGLVQALLNDLQQRARADFLDKRSVRKAHRRSLIVDGVKALAASPEQKQHVSAFMTRFAATQSDPKFYEVIDIARRIAGTGSLGVQRYVVLIEGKGSPDGNFLLDLKEAKPSAMGPHLARLGIRQPAWTDEASRVVTIQKRMQAVEHAFLQAVQLEGLPCILKGLQPAEDRVSIADWGNKLGKLKEVAVTMGRVLAWDHLRASGRSGSAIADELMAFAQREDWMQDMLDAADTMTQTTNLQWQGFVKYMQANPNAMPVQG